MNGRCTADPLDHADDICEFCGDEFCRSCLIKTRNGKGQLICRECAISNSGIKGSKSTKPRVSKAQVQHAREALEEAKGTRTAKSFLFFDEDENYVAPTPISAEPTIASEPIAEVSDGTRKRRFALRRKHDDIVDDLEPAVVPATTDTELPPPAPASIPVAEPAPAPATSLPGRSTPATTLIESGALTDAPADLPVAKLTPVPAAADESRSNPVPSSHGSTAGSPEPELEHSGDEPATIAAATPVPSSLADRLRSSSPRTATAPSPAPSPAIGHRPASPPTNKDPFADHASDEALVASSGNGMASSVDLSFPTAIDRDPFGDTTTTFDWQATSNGFAEGDLSDDPFATGDPFEAPPVSSTSPAAPLLDPTDPFTPAPAHRVAAFDASSVEPPTDPFDTQSPSPAPAPMSAPMSMPSVEVPRERAADQFLPPTQSIPERRSMPSPAPTTSPRTAPSPPSHRAAAPSPSPNVPVSAAAPMGSSTSPSSRSAASADTDANGDWIPPLLRGIAPVAERRAEPLPRRRHQD